MCREFNIYQIMKKLVFLSLMSACWLPLHSRGQNVYIMYQPVKYAEAPDGDILADSKSAKTGPIYWVVCSDRTGNPIYNTADASSPIGTAGFMDKYYVTNERGDYLELYKYEDGIKAEGGSKRNLLSKKARRIGWMSKNNLLLWFNCLQDKTTHFTEKALAVVNEKTLKQSGQFVTKNSDLKLFTDPGLQKESNNTVKMFQFLYVYKREGNHALIGKTHLTTFIRVDKDVLGWVNEDILQKWDSRVCLEPNFDADAAEKRKNSNIKVSLFFNRDEAGQWDQGSGMPKAVWSDDPYEKRWVATQKRLPIFEVDGDLVRTGFATPLYNEQSMVVATDAQLAKTRKANNAVIREYRRINIVFVVDGAMDKYITAIKSSLQHLVDKNNEYFKQGVEKNTYSYGAVVYRSQDDKTCPKGDLSLRKIDLTTNSGNIISFLDRELQTSGCNENSLNRDVNGAVGEALKMIQTANQRSTQSNYVLVIGGATGNKLPEMKTTPDLIAKYDVNLSIFQVFNPSPEEYDNFSTNFIDLVRASKKAKFIQMQKNMRGTNAMHEPDFTFIGDGSQNLYRLDYPDKSPLQGSLCFPEKGKTISAEVMNSVLDTSFTYFTNTLENVLATASTAITGEGQRKINNFSAAVQDYLQRVGANMNDYALAATFTGKNYQFFEPAWTSVKMSKLEEPVFKHVIYASEEDLNEMIREFRTTQFDGSPSDIRDKIYDAYQSLIATYFGGESGVDEGIKSRLTLDSVISKITGLPSRSDLLRQVKIDEIKDVQKVSDEQIETIQKAISDSIDKLNQAKGDVEGTMRDPTDDGIFYWIPEDYLP